MLRSLPQLQPLFALVHHLEKVMWEILGGYPRDYEGLLAEANAARDPSLRLQVVKEFLMKKLNKAFCDVRIEAAANPRIMDIFDRFKKGESVSISQQIARPSPDRIFTKDELLLLPASPAIAFILKHGLYSQSTLPPFSAIKQMTESSNNS